VRILVFVKQVADTEARIFIKSDQRSLEIENKYNMNFFDEFAVEAAVRIKEKMKESQVTVCTWGPKRAVEALRTAIAMGADRAFLIDSTGLETDDSGIIARVLAGFAKQESYDLIICGRQAIDDENGTVGVMVAEYLDIPHMSAISRLEVLDDGKIRVERESEDGREVIEAASPVLVTAQKGLNEPRVPLITGVMKAMKAQIPAVDPVSLVASKDQIEPGAAKITMISYESPAGRPQVRIVEGESPEEKVKGLVRLLKEEAKII
jgi:electron transfer flavoprotein beta subunit